MLQMKGVIKNRDNYSLSVAQINKMKRNNIGDVKKIDPSELSEKYSRNICVIPFS